MIDAIVFDMDGVLIDSEPLHLATTQEVLAPHDRRLDEAFYWARVGMGEVEFFADVVAHLELDVAPEVLAHERQRVYVDRLVASALTPMPGVLECLLRLGADGYRLAVASSATRRQVDVVVAKLGLRRTFGATVSIDDVEHGKPAPDLFLEAARRLGVDPARCVVVEDAVHGVTAARAAGMAAVALPRVGDDGARHRDAGAAAVITSLAELDQDAVESWVAV